MIWEIQFSGTKDRAKEQMHAQVLDPERRKWFEALIDSMPGTHVSVSGMLSGTPDQGFGSLSLSGSSWTIGGNRP